QSTPLPWRPAAVSSSGSSPWAEGQRDKHGHDNKSLNLREKIVHTVGPLPGYRRRGEFMLSLSAQLTLGCTFLQSRKRIAISDECKMRRSRLFGQLPGENKLTVGSRLLVSPFPEIKIIPCCCGVL